MITIVARGAVSIHVMVAHSTDHVSDYVSKPDDEGNE
jgi:hypothetical protein